MPGSANRISVGADGSAWMIKNKTTAGASNIFKWTRWGWEEQSALAETIAVGNADSIWMTDGQNRIWRYK